MAEIARFVQTSIAFDDETVQRMLMPGLDTFRGLTYMR